MRLKEEDETYSDLYHLNQTGVRADRSLLYKFTLCEFILDFKEFREPDGTNLLPSATNIKSMLPEALARVFH